MIPEVFAADDDVAGAVDTAISVAGRVAGSSFKDSLNGGTSTPSQQAATFLQRNFPSQAGDTAQVVFQTADDARKRLATLPFIEHDLVTFDYIELVDNSPA